MKSSGLVAPIQQVDLPGHFGPDMKHALPVLDTLRG